MSKRNHRFNPSPNPQRAPRPKRQTVTLPAGINMQRDQRAVLLIPPDRFSVGRKPNLVVLPATLANQLALIGAKAVEGAQIVVRPKGHPPSERMMLFEIVTGFSDQSYERAYCWARDEEEAAALAKEKFPPERHASLRAFLLFRGDDAPFCSDPDDQGWLWNGMSSAEQVKHRAKEKAAREAAEAESAARREQKPGDNGQDETAPPADVDPPAAST